MSGDKKSESGLRNPVGWIFRASMMLFGAVIALNLAVAYLRPILPWVIGSIALAMTIWLLVAVVRWRRSQW